MIIKRVAFLRLGAAALALGLFSCGQQAAHAQGSPPVTLPQVNDSFGDAVQTQGSVLTDSAGHEKGTAGNPVYVTGGGGGGGTSGGTATSAPPAYANGATGQALSLDLSGNLRTILNGLLPGFAVTPTFNIGTAPLLSIGALPALPGFATTPTFNLGTAPSLTIATTPGYVSAKVIQQTPTIAASSAFAAGQVVGGLITIANASRAPGGNGTLQDAVVMFADAQNQPIDAVIFSANPTSTTFTSGGAYSLNAADVPKVLRVIHLADFTSHGTPTTAEMHGLATKYVTDGSGNLYAVLVARGAFTTGPANDVTVQEGVEPNG